MNNSDNNLDLNNNLPIRENQALVGNEVIRAKNLTVAFKTKDGALPIIRKTSISIDKKEIVGLVGESGSGKSVLLKTLIGFNDNSEVDADTLNLGGVDLLIIRKRDWKKIRGTKIAYIPQDPLTSLNPTMRIGNQLKEAILVTEKKVYKETVKRLKEQLANNSIDQQQYKQELAQAKANKKYSLSRKGIKARLNEIFEFIGIEDVSRRLRAYPNEFSGGMRQRIAIAIAVISKPDVIIADEPTTALDVTIQAKVLDLLKKLRDELGTTIIFISHNIALVANFCDYIYVMYAGKIVEQGTTEEVFTDPKHPYTWALISSLPEEGSDDELLSIPGTPPNMFDLPKGDPFAQRNEYALKIDFEKEPPMFKVTDTHWAATWLLHKDYKGTAIPKIIANKIAIAKKSFTKKA
ncbi:ABC transporter ATP-binding protein [Malacoplasma penetrans]|uniref:ABC transporter ATP-binding protein n=1 Tax=Malacoplasma penetrans TaxID=28227 RepID=UPI0010139AB1|nr:ABC transporter ATP-binding protein [Malacoplasma penetrans]RXY96395.1 ABC transporter ATP-binding protein [Malacoplasma penetrans]